MTADPNSLSPETGQPRYWANCARCGKVAEVEIVGWAEHLTSYQHPSPTPLPRGWSEVGLCPACFGLLGLQTQTTTTTTTTRRTI